MFWTPSVYRVSLRTGSLFLLLKNNTTLGNLELRLCKLT